MNSYSIAGGDDGCYGPSFGPATAEEVGVFGNEGSKCLVLRLHEPIQDGAMRIQLLAVRPRYVGVSFEALRTTGATVGVSIVLPGKEEQICEGLSEENSKYWAIGTCKRSDA